MTMEPSPNLQEIFANAVERQQAFDYPAATAAYREVLARFGAVGPAIYNLFTVLLSDRRFIEARRLVAEQAEGLGGDPRLYLGIIDDLEAADGAAQGPLGTVIIPAFNAQDYILRALDSILVSIRLCRQRHGERPIAMVVVDDGSTDDTAALCHAWAKDRGFGDFRLLRLGTNGGQAAARNAGTKIAQGDLLWFLDADDEFMPEHIADTYDILRRYPNCAFVRTGLFFDTIHDEVSEQMRERNMLTSTINLCIRRDCHDFLGGIPDTPFYRIGGGEDAAYADLMFAFFWGVLCKRETVIYRRRPGNSLDRQATRFVHGDGESAANRPHDAPSSAQLAGQIFANQRAVEIRSRAAAGTAGLPPLRAKPWPRECYRVE